MAAKNILHMITPLKHMSPFDINMAIDAGYDHVATYADVGDREVAGLVQDAIFSRPPDHGVRTGLFIAGKNAIQALDMAEAARRAMVPPFEISVFADPAGSFTTAAAMVARTEKLLKERHDRNLKGLRVSVFGATGVVGFSSAAIAALEGANAILVGYDGPDRVQKAASEIESRFGAKADFADGSSDDLIGTIVENSDVIFCAGRAGVQIVSRAHLAKAGKLLVAADVNAVPPAGIEGLEVHAKDQVLNDHGTLGIGPLAIGNIKYKTEQGLFERMIAADKPLMLDFRDAFALARHLAK